MVKKKLYHEVIFAYLILYDKINQTSFLLKLSYDQI